MDNQRAKEIISSPIMADVTYNGTKIYMEDVNETERTCTVHYFNHPDDKLTVPLKSLKEHGAHAAL